MTTDNEPSEKKVYECSYPACVCEEGQCLADEANERAANEPSVAELVEKARRGVLLTSATEQAAWLRAMADSLDKSPSGFTSVLVHYEEAEAIAAELTRLERRCAEMEKALRLHEPWPLLSIVETLAEATEHLLDIHDCDATKHTLYRAALVAARASLPPERANEGTHEN